MKDHGTVSDSINWKFNPRKYKPKNVTRRNKWRGGGGVGGGEAIGPFPNAFDTIHLINLKSPGV